MKCIIFLHEWVDNIEISICKGTHNFILVVIDSVLEEILEFSDKGVKLLCHAKVSIG